MAHARAILCAAPCVRISSSRSCLVATVSCDLEQNPRVGKILFSVAGVKWLIGEEEGSMSWGYTWLARARRDPPQAIEIHSSTAPVRPMAQFPQVRICSNAKNLNYKR